MYNREQNEQTKTVGLKSGPVAAVAVRFIIVNARLFITLTAIFAKPVSLLALSAKICHYFCIGPAVGAYGNCDWSVYGFAGRLDYWFASYCHGENAPLASTRAIFTGSVMHA